MNTFKETADRGKDNDQRIIPSVLIFIFSLFLISCGGSADRNDNTLSNAFPGFKIGDQVWMTKNYDGITFKNGDSIPHARSIEEWQKAGEAAKPAWCNYQNDSSFGRKYGRIYNWYAITDPRGFGPEGWHVPTNEEWITLENHLGNSEAGVRIKCNGVHTANGNDTTQFCALLGGYRGKEGGFSGIEEFTYLASSSERDQKENDVWGRGIHTANSTIMRCGLYKAHGLYVRLIKD